MRIRRFFWLLHYVLDTGRFPSPGAPTVTALDLRVRGIKREVDPNEHKHVEENRKSIYRYLDLTTLPLAPSAWSIGEALRALGISWSSGLLGLCVAGWLEDVVGVLGSLRRDDIVAHASQLIGMLDSIASVQVQSIDMLILSDALFHASDGSASVPIDERKKREERWTKAKTAWTLDQKLATALEAAWARWLPRRTKTRMKRFLGTAMSVAQDNKYRIEQKEELTAYLLGAWIRMDVLPDALPTGIFIIDSDYFQNGELMARNPMP